jgi:ubiquinone/menaquinone biosynthesis C-methylase UbiE
MMTTTESQRPFVPGMGVDWLLPLYDPFTRLLGLERVRREFLREADLRPGQRILDIGCGTGSLAILTKRLFPETDVLGLDPDPKALARAVGKARRAGVEVAFEHGFSDVLNHPDASFDRVFSSFMFHHLGRREKEGTLRAIRRVLRPRGSLHLVDFGGPEAAAGDGPRRRGLHSHGRLSDNGEQTILGLLNASGLASAAKTGERTLLGLVRIVCYRAEKPLA